MLSDLFIRGIQTASRYRVGKPRIRPYYEDWLHSAIAYSPANR